MTSIRAFLAVLAVGAPLVAAAVASAQTATPALTAGGDAPNWMQRWSEDRSAMLDARLAGLKAGLRLTPDQEKLWGPFEAAIRDFAQMRMARMMARGAADDGGANKAGPLPSPIERLDRMATRLADLSAELKKIADAGKPLYASLDDNQKGMFGFLSREMMMMGRGHHGMGEWRHHEDEDEDSDDEE